MSVFLCIASGSYTHRQPWTHRMDTGCSSFQCGEFDFTLLIIQQLQE